MKKIDPLVSVIINCFNGEKYLDQALDSILKQTYNNWEVIFWDNKSTDKSYNIYKNYADNDKRFKYFFAENHTLLYEARNLALKNCVGEVITFLDVDDIWIPTKLEKQISLFDNDKVGLVYGNFSIFNQYNKKYKLAFNQNLVSGYILDDLLKHYCVGLLTIAIRTNAIQEYIKFFNDQYHIIGDFDAVIKISKNWKILAIQEPIAISRKHSESESYKNRFLLGEELKIWLKNAERDEILSKKNLSYIKNNYLYSMAVHYSLSGKKIKAMEIILKLKLGLYLWKLIISIFLPKKINNYFNKL